MKLKINSLKMITAQHLVVGINIAGNKSAGASRRWPASKPVAQKTHLNY
ncbi:hypothetical protein [Paenibacillus sp. UNC496MF]|nr:hypothetical protein [Paenibacillus sp. UNC496MF]